MRGRLLASLALGTASGCMMVGLAQQRLQLSAKDTSAELAEVMRQVVTRLEKIEKHIAPEVPATAQQKKWADDDMARKLFTEEDIQNRISELGKQISKDYLGKDLVVVGLMTGVFVFMADLVRHIEVPHEVQFVTVSSYGAGTVSSGNVKIKKDLDTPVYGKHVLLLDEICDSGQTMASLEKLMRDRGAASVRSCVLLNKAARRIVPVEPDYVGLVCPDEFVVGYGMDYKEKYRSLPYVGVLHPRVYKQ